MHSDEPLTPPRIETMMLRPGDKLGRFTYVGKALGFPVVAYSDDPTATDAEIMQFGERTLCWWTKKLKAAETAKIKRKRESGCNRGGNG